MRKFLVIGVSGVALAALAASLFLARTDSGLPWLPLTRSDLIRLLAGDKSGDIVKIETPEDLFATTKVIRVTLTKNGKAAAELIIPIADRIGQASGARMEPTAIRVFHSPPICRSYISPRGYSL